MLKKFKGQTPKGTAIIIALLIIFVIIVVSAGLFGTLFSDKNIADRVQLTTQTLYMAEGATENAIAQFTFAVANFLIPIDAANYNVITTFSTLGGATVTSTITRLENSERLLIENNTNVYVRNYEISTTATHPQNPSVSVTVHQIIARRLIPTFQHAVFYNNDLEMLPGPDMTLSGRIHSNHDIYLGSNNTLTIDSTYLRSAGEIFESRKDSATTLPGDVSIRIDAGGFALMNGLDSNDPNWTADALTRWNGTVQSAVHGVTNLTAPSTGSIQTGGYYQMNANVSIVNNTLYKNGAPLAEGIDYPVGTITASTTLYNNREAKNIRMTTIDMEKLAGNSGTCAGGPCPNNMPANGLLYTTRNDALATEEAGIRLVNGAQIDSAIGLTVVSDDPVYIQGNYNTVNERPTSIICDAINLLSNNWSDANSTLNVNSRAANATTYNVAFVAGIDETTAGGYNGGLENYPRLHENWTGKNLNIKGSFVALWDSTIATGAWQYGNPQYTAPNRNWEYNTSFNNPANLPPFTPWAVEARRIAWWKD